MFLLPLLSWPLQDIFFLQESSIHFFMPIRIHTYNVKKGILVTNMYKLACPLSHIFPLLVILNSRFDLADSFDHNFFLFFYYFFSLYNVVLVLPYINMHPLRVYTCSPSWTPLPPPSPYHHSGSSQCTSPKLPVSCIEPGLAIHFLCNIIHVLMPFSQITPHSLSHRVQKTVLYICVSFAVSHTGLSLPSF